jgi:hypothetical protein
MDPDETLRRIRRTINQMRVDESTAIREAHADEIAEAFEDLDLWLSNGGFPPSDWALDPA